MAPNPLADCPILLVDDEEANLDLLEAFLLSEGYLRLARTTDARRAVPLFLEDRPDLVLLDLHMPYRSGFEVLRELRGLTPAGDYLPVLVLTADITSEARERALSEGARDFITKPFDGMEVLLRVRNLLETRLLHRRQSEARLRAEAAERRSALLAEASRVLSTSLDHATTLSKLARLMVPRFADLCAVGVDGEGGFTPLSSAAADSPGEEALRGWLREREHGEALAELLRPGRTLSFEAAAGGGEGEPRLGDLLAPLGARSAVLLPLGHCDPPLGGLLLARTAEGRGFDADDRLLAEEIAARTALAVENARLFADAQWATRARDRMLSVVAHDLRNPLALVGMGSEMLLQLLPSEEESYQRNTLSHILQATQRMQRLIEDLLDVSRFEQGSFSLRVTPLALEDLFAELEATFRPLAAARSVRLEVHEDGGRGALWADGDRLLQVLSNLVGNALKFTPDAGRVRVAWGAAGDELRVSVADTGPGIPAESLPHVFGAFWQAAASERRGVGLGLWIARSLVEAHGGRIWVDSRVGEGTVFHFAVPWATEAPAGQPGILPEPSDPSPPGIVPGPWVS